MVGVFSRSCLADVSHLTIGGIFNDFWDVFVCRQRQKPIMIRRLLPPAECQAKT